MPTFKELFEKFDSLELRVSELESERNFLRELFKDKVPTPRELNKSREDTPVFDFKRKSDR